MKQCPKCKAIVENDSALFCSRCASPLSQSQTNVGYAYESITNGVNNGIILGNNSNQHQANTNYPPEFERHPNYLNANRLSSTSSVFFIIGGLLIALFSVLLGLVTISFYNDIHRTAIDAMSNLIAVYVLICLISSIVSVCYSIRFFSYKKLNDFERAKSISKKAKLWLLFALIILLITIPFEMIVYLFINFDPLY